jgi:thymidylate synthase
MTQIDDLYLKLGELLQGGEEVESRVGRTRSLWAPSAITVDVATSFPLLQCKFVDEKKAFGELLWMIGGGNNAHDLHEKHFGNSRIWDGDAVAFAKRRAAVGMATMDGDLGRVYGQQWTRWRSADDGLNQLDAMVELLRREPSSRRAVVTAFDPMDAEGLTSALPPCHMMFQVGRRSDGTHLSMVQRSADYMLGLPYNLANYACLLSLLADLFGEKARTYTHLFSGDVHVYEAHDDVTLKMLNAAHGCEWPPLELRIAPGNRKFLSDYKLADLSVVRKYDGEPYENLGCPVYRARVQTVEAEKKC